MQQHILATLARIEREHQVRILYACEAGSRASGLASADSDYDVRFIYVHESEWYLRVDHEQCRDVIELPIDDALDVSGWDLKKTLKLLKKSNPSLMEWMGSPMVYRSDRAFIAAFKQLIAQAFSPKVCFHHYANMAKGNQRNLSTTPTLKRYFYILRPLLAMEWIAQGRGLVPSEFAVLVEQLVTDPELVSAIDGLIAHKQQGSDAKWCVEPLNAFIEAELARFAAATPTLDLGAGDYRVINRFFLDVLQGKYTEQ
uniref:nucleotidyltransferase domain-containing protein n=1 Tax=Thaumasiovibrio occultus TaxID=1891184 RepID=UPI000B34D9D3|nr:nucleotidyltransferase domain-containing protein [Thaumasiovibrio occultus]